MNTEFSVSVIQLDGTATVRVAGELDLATIPELQAALADVHGHVVFDLGQLTFIDAIGVDELLHSADGQGLEIRAASPFVRRVLRLVDLGHVIPPETVR
jgi:anti-anti-sigma factor